MQVNFSGWKPAFQESKAPQSLQETVHASPQFSGFTEPVSDKFVRFAGCVPQEPAEPGPFDPPPPPEPEPSEEPVPQVPADD